jgi:hypothetical protein
MDMSNVQVEPTIEHDASYRSDSIVPKKSLWNETEGGLSRVRRPV